MFGTWARMLPEKFDARWVDGRGNPVQDLGNLQARRDLWRQCLHRGFPNATNDPRGYGTGNKVRDLRKLAHLHDRVLLPLLNSISHDLRDWAQNRSRVRAILAARPSNP
ncbi:Uncharacterised protein [Mycobacteroides abscessus subsp. abscessus]|nr:Uncharacterised protein [Mycobacteroides abscessus subsp. abscessus]